MVEYPKSDKVCGNALLGSWLCIAACALVLLTAPVAQALSLTARFDLTDDELVSLFNGSDGVERIESGLLLADIWASDYGPEKARSILVDLPSNEEIEQIAGPDLAD